MSGIALGWKDRQFGLSKAIPLVPLVQAARPQW
jgi:hypothetical protein